MKNNRVKLSAAERKAALSSVKKAKQTGEGVRVAAKPRQISAPSYDSLPGFKELQVQRRVADLLELENPFFKVHEGCAGARTVVGGKELINFASYDYLGLNAHPDLRTIAKDALDTYGVSASASRIVAGERPVHRALEEAIARLYSVESAVAFVSGHATNVTTLGQILQAEDLIIHDSFIHNSIVTGAQLSGAARQAFPHNDLEALEEILRARAGRHPKTLIVVEGVYSMDGDYPDLPRLIELKQQYGAWLMVDEAHSLGVMGKTGRGIAEHFGIDPKEVDLWMGTFSKTLAGCGGYIAGAQDLIDYLKFSVSGFVFSVGMPPAVAAASTKAIELMQAHPERVGHMQENGAYFLQQAKARGLDTGTSEGFAVVPVILGDSLSATIASAKMMERGFNVQPIIFPAVPEKSARLRFFLTCDHTKSDLDKTLDALCEVTEELKQNPPDVLDIIQKAGPMLNV